MEGSKLISKSRSKLRPEGSRGASSAVDVAFLTLMVSLASLLLIDAGLPRDDLGREAYAERLAQDILLFLQRAPTESFGDFSYSPGLRELRAVAEPSAPSEKRIEEETFVQLIAEDVLIDVASGGNEDFGEELEGILREVLDSFAGRRFGYRLEVKAGIPKGVTGRRQSVISIEDFCKGSELLCSRRISARIAAPKTGIDGQREAEFIPMTLILELLSRRDPGRSSGLGKIGPGLYLKNDADDLPHFIRTYRRTVLLSHILSSVPTVHIASFEVSPRLRDCP